MSNDSSTPPEPHGREGEGADAVAPPPVFEESSADAVVPPPPTFDKGPADVVPPPPTFDGPLTGSVEPVSSATASGDDVVPPAPVFEGSTGDAVVPPPPTFDGPATGSTAAASDSLRSTARRAASRPPAPTGIDAVESGPAPDLDPAFAAPETPSSGSYRGLTIAIYGLLLVLLAAAIVLGIYLLNNTTLDWSQFGAAAVVIESSRGSLT
jgi:hypothetical protein